MITNGAMNLKYKKHVSYFSIKKIILIEKFFSSYKGISLLSLPRKVYAKCLGRKCRETVESKLHGGQSGFRPGRSTTDQIFTLKQIFEKSWEFGKDLFTCFVDLEKAYDQVSRDKLRKILQEYGADGQLFRANKSFYCQPRFVFGQMARNQSRSMWALDSSKDAFCQKKECFPENK